MIGVMMKLGEFKFSISTAAYQSFSRSSGFRWQAQERFGQMPAYQFTGLGNDEITLSGDIYPSYAGGIHQVDWMRFYAGQGKPLMMVDGKGYVWGKWVILSIDESQEIFFDNGVARKQTFNLKISRYVDIL